VDLAAVNKPASHISGDFYNWFELPDGRTVVTIGDVTGHGMAAAFLMATTQLLVRAIMPRVLDPGICLQQINKQMMMQTFNGQFVTLLILVLDPARCRMDVATAGHPAPITGTDGAFEPLPVEPQLVLGVEPVAGYSSQRFDLLPGQSFILYSDGAIDAQRPDGERFSTEALAASLHGRFDSAESILASAEAALVEFRAGRDLADDLTLVAIQVVSQSTRTGPRDADATLSIVGRTKELIIRSGFNVYPAEVEAVLNAHPSVVHSAVVGRVVPGNEEVVAFVELAPGKLTTPAELDCYVAGELVAYKRPAEIVIVASLPVAANGKILKHRLAELAQHAATPIDSRL
jgi:hypothetical protein